MKPLQLLMVFLILTPMVLGNEIHPHIDWRDTKDQPIVPGNKGQKLSTKYSCGGCHDIETIRSGSVHFQKGTSSPPIFPNEKDWSSESKRLYADGGEKEEINCFLCHIEKPDHDARNRELLKQKDAQPIEATLAITGLFMEKNKRWVATDAILRQNLTIQKPESANCTFCHASKSDNNVQNWQKSLHGLNWSSKRISDGDLNLKNKKELSHAFDIHAERGVRCADCHYSTNHPAYYQESKESKPNHLIFDGRKISIHDYLKSPGHRMAMSEDGMSCERCHDATAIKENTLHSKRHLETLACQSCHIPKIYDKPAKAVDWSIPEKIDQPHVEFRQAGYDKLSEGFSPYLFPSQNSQGGKIAPHNFVSFRYWVSGEESKMVSREILKKALFNPKGRLSPDLLEVGDLNKNGILERAERKENREILQEVARTLLQGIGVERPKIKSEEKAFAINHGVIKGKEVTQNCLQCHQTESQLRQPMEKPVADRMAGIHIPGHSRILILDLFALIIALLALGGTGVHGFFRWFLNRGKTETTTETERQEKRERNRRYAYNLYERLWHWLQVLTIVLLFLTGLEIHVPDWISLFGFETTITIHLYLGLILFLNALPALIYHLANGRIRHFLPSPKGLIARVIRQQTYYMKGIFSNQPHPFEETPEKPLNPLQQVTYLMLLNILLPVQIVSGAILWLYGITTLPLFLEESISLVAILHTAGAWLFGLFFVIHVYMTTTGKHPLELPKAMITGWREFKWSKHSKGRKS